MNAPPGMQDYHALDEAGGAGESARCHCLELVNGEVLFLQAKIYFESLGPQSISKIGRFGVSATYDKAALFTGHF